MLWPYLPVRTMASAWLASTRVVCRTTTHIDNDGPTSQDMLPALITGILDWTSTSLQKQTGTDLIYNGPESTLRFVLNLKSQTWRIA